MVSKWSFETSFFVAISNLTLIALHHHCIHGSVCQTKMALEWPFETLVLLKPLALPAQQQDVFRGSSHLDDGVDTLEKETDVF